MHSAPGWDGGSKEEEEPPSKSFRYLPLPSAANNAQAQLDTLRKTDDWAVVEQNLRGKTFTAASMFTGTGCPSVWTRALQEGLDVKVNWRWHCDNDDKVAQPWLMSAFPDCCLFSNAASLSNRTCLDLVSKERRQVASVDILVAAITCSALTKLSIKCVSNPLVEGEDSVTKQNLLMLRGYLIRVNRRPKVVFMESLNAFDKGHISMDDTQLRALPADTSAYLTAKAFFTELGYVDLSASQDSRENGSRQSRKRSYYSWHDMLAIEVPLDQDLFFRVVRATRLPMPAFSSCFQSVAEYKRSPWRLTRPDRKESKDGKEADAARTQYRSVGEDYPPAYDFSLPATWNLPAHAYVDLVSVNKRELEILFWPYRFQIPAFFNITPDS